MNTENTDEQRTTSENIAVADKLPFFQCPKCPKSFTTPQGLSMHDLRVHSKKLGTGYKWKQRQSHNWDTSVLEKERLARRRAYQRKLRARYKLQGRDSRGYPVKTVDPRKWTTERLSKFQSTMRRKALEKKNPQKRLQFVYPITEAVPTEQQPKSVIRFCPHCGTNIERYL